MPSSPRRVLRVWRQAWNVKSATPLAFWIARLNTLQPLMGLPWRWPGKTSGLSSIRVGVDSLTFNWPQSHTVQVQFAPGHSGHFAAPLARHKHDFEECATRAVNRIGRFPDCLDFFVAVMAFTGAFAVERSLDWRE